MNPVQTIKYGTSFPSVKPSNGSIFVRTDMPGMKVFQYDAKNDVYFQIEGIHIGNDDVVPPVVVIKYYIVGFCEKRPTDRELTDKEYFSGNLETLYTVTTSQLYPPNSCYQNKRMVVLMEFDTFEDAENHKNSYEYSLLATLEQQCQNRITLDISWGNDDGCDLDISFVVENVTFGYGQQNSSPYASWYGDSDGCSGTEQVSINKNAMIADGIKTTTVIIRAHWYHIVNSGNCYLTVSDGVTSMTRMFNSQLYSQDTSGSDFDVLGNVVIDLEHDTFVIDGGTEQNIPSRNSLLNMLPEDLR